MKTDHTHHQRVQSSRGSLAGANSNIANNQPSSDSALPSRPDLFIPSESPLVQEIHLHQKLKEHIKNSNGRRYGSSELYLAKRGINNNHNNNNHHERSPLASSCSGPSEVQSTTQNIGGRRNSTSNTLTDHNINQFIKPFNNHQSTQKPNAPLKGHLHQVDSSTTNSHPATTSEQQVMLNNKNVCSPTFSSNPCQVCMVKKVRQELMDINKMVLERNEQISKMKAKCLRSYFERQMKDKD